MEYLYNVYVHCTNGMRSARASALSALSHSSQKRARELAERIMDVNARTRKHPRTAVRAMELSITPDPVCHPSLCTIHVQMHGHALYRRMCRCVCVIACLDIILYNYTVNIRAPWNRQCTRRHPSKTTTTTLTTNDVRARVRMPRSNLCETRARREQSAEAFNIHHTRD